MSTQVLHVDLAQPPSFLRPCLCSHAFTQCYAVLAYFSPDLIVSRPSERKYRCASSPTKSLALGYITDPPSVDLSVIIPAYNETARLPDMFETTLKHLASTASTRTYEVVIVDDGSKDGTSELALKLAISHSKADVRVVTLVKNVGKGGAVRHGMLHGRGRRLLMVDADGASRFEDLEALWREMDKIAPKDEAAVVVGSRAHLVKTEAVVKVGSISYHLLRSDILMHYIFARDPSSATSSCTASTLSCVSSE